jgi:hypothetical protein
VAEEMTKAKFEIGENEKHTIIVNANPLLKYITIEVDGEKVVNESHFSPLPKKFQFEVGNTEKHQVEINTGPFSSTKVTVDGKAAQKT